ncbi:DeoR/GlpR family DNA-binding transcription regulator [Clostridium luticellarii]|jgi:DeoR/GlpR family transcriptional regulator of sugar metabolism|uniref:HTH-type transcriptional repressor GlcR n=1 Tax=Clostridium luticellarii TaxID=1691940 RepID=A0A2T0BNE3_9CLOT|nr:DeoR/GlpR family DNA-binding transcription regulator [Clostridium luticellarii]MCI1945380.1 DeoR/GlpR family DNA-binding transcription regulator [Clostridium luticellarii]MCI1968715.1 DeoR/GlpR family DNA-binding transcription regulator [Clostridium luticellarii]MCI1994930.1 DeoR/GlpR family DNA-binding transcription regulator [Clostridium luticellarii]MCI2040141.1 DeoR/GlpR family DNA-binding transcription regulator [Clostridium luticellarii]PRR85387.1 HTH-type transcriptional repressor Gl
MLPEERRIKIVDILKKNGRAEVQILADKMKVSKMTIRRDLEFLEKKRLLMRTHGGAVFKDIISYEVPYMDKEVANKSEKERIGRKAAEFVKEGQSLILDAGTTCLEVARCMKNMKDITVITNDIKIVGELFKYTNIRLFCTGGLVQGNVGALIGKHAEYFLQSFNVDYAFVGVTSVNEEYAVSTPTAEKAYLKRLMIDSANKSVFLADHSKFNKTSFSKVCSMDEVDVLISDIMLDDKIKKGLQNLSIKSYFV